MNGYVSEWLHMDFQCPVLRSPANDDFSKVSFFLFHSYSVYCLFVYIFLLRYSQLLKFPVLFLASKQKITVNLRTNLIDMDPLRHNDYTNVGDSTLQNAMNEALEGSASNSFTDPSTEPPYLLDSLAQPFGGGIWNFDELIYEPLIPPTAAAPPTFPQQPQNPAAATSEAAAGGTTTTTNNNNNNNAVATFDPSISIHPTINVPFGAMPGDYPPPANWHPLAQDAMPPTPPPTTFDEEYVARYGPPQPQPPRTNVRLLQPSNSTSLRQLSTSSRRKSADETHRRRGSSSRRRNSVQNSVAHQVSLTLHAPTSVYKDGIEWINFLYSHDRIVTEYSIRADIESVNLNQVPDDFKNANTVGSIHF